jgi:hypothetical protein
MPLFTELYKFLSIHIVDTERGIVCNVRENCCKKHREHRCSGNSGITTNKTATVQKNLHDFSHVV